MLLDVAQTRGRARVMVAVTKQSVRKKTSQSKAADSGPFEDIAATNAGPGAIEKNHASVENRYWTVGQPKRALVLLDFQRGATKECPVRSFVLRSCKNGQVFVAKQYV